MYQLAIYYYISDNGLKLFYTKKAFTIIISKQQNKLNASKK